MVEGEFVQVVDWARELVVFEKQSFQAGEAVEGGGKGLGEVVEAHVQANQVHQIKQKGWDLVAEQVALNVEVVEVDAGGQI